MNLAHHNQANLTKPEKLVLDGMRVMFTLAEARTKSRSSCHIDWISLTFKESDIFKSDFYNAAVDDSKKFGEQTLLILRMLAFKLSQLTGFSVGEYVTPGFNYYKTSILILNNQQKRVGFISGGGEKQSDTFNLVLRGEGCTFSKFGWEEHLYYFSVGLNGKIARVDLALDLFNGELGGVDSVRSAYKNGQFDYLGRRPTHDLRGGWDSPDGRGRTFYVGQSGTKCVAAYEKGRQFGMTESAWWRYEQRFGSKDRILPLDILIEPDKYFAGAYSFNKTLLDHVEPVVIKKNKTGRYDGSSCYIKKVGLD